MKRSEINQIIRRAEEFFARHQFHLPVWSLWGREDWEQKIHQAREVIDCSLGWDITDFGSGDFHRRGLVLFTLRNGKPGSYPKPYAEKIMMVGEGQETPFHFHWNKMEDIINRGGGEMIFELYRADEGEGFLQEPVEISIDGVRQLVEPGKPLSIFPGQSLTLPQYLYHRFYARPGSGPVLCGEVSMVNDDTADNRFYEPVGRFPEVEEDEAPFRLMVPDYSRLSMTAESSE